MSQDTAQHGAATKPDPSGLATALDATVETLIAVTAPENWSRRDVTAAQDAVVAAVSAVIYGAARLAGALRVALLEPLVAPTDSPDGARQLLLAERDSVRAGLAARETTALSVLGERLDAVVSAALAVADQHGVTVRILVELNATGLARPSPAARETAWSIECGRTA